MLLPDLHGGSEPTAGEQALTTWKSERKKKPSSRYNEEAGFISDWNDAQLVKYIDACGISFTNDMNACLNHLRQLELLHLAPLREPTSSLEERVV